MELSKKEIELLSGLLSLLRLDIIDLEVIEEQYFNKDSFISELDLSVIEELENKLDDHYQYVKE